MSKRFILYFLIATAIGGVFLWLSVRELQFDAVSAYLATADYGKIGLYTALFTLVYGFCHFSRIVRWHALVEPITDLPARSVHQICIVGFTAILLLPFRLGEFVRVFLLGKRAQVPMTKVLGSVVVERVVDGLVITGMMFVCLAFYDGDNGGFATSIAIVAACIFIPASAGVLLAIWRREWATWVIDQTAGRVSSKIAGKLHEIMVGFLDGLSAAIGGGTLLKFGFWTTCYWVANGASMYILARFAFDLPVTFFEGYTMLAVLVLGIMIPAGPAMAGNFEYFVTQAVALLVVITQYQAQVAAFAAWLHIVQFIIIVVPGVIVMWLDPETRHLIRLSEESQGDDSTASE